MPKLIADLPEHLLWLTEKVESLARPGAFLVREPKSVAAPGSTRTWGMPDIPLGRGWPEEDFVARAWCQSPYDGESFWMQVNLQELPAELRLAGTPLAELPVVGVLWVFLDLSDSEGGWKARTQFDPRPASSIQWRHRTYPFAGMKQPEAARWVLKDTMTCATEATLPEVASDHHHGVGMCVDFDEWWERHYCGRQPSDTQVGGWIHPIQGDMDSVRKTVFLAMERQEFGDHGAVYVHYTPERGFWADVTTH